MVVGMRMSADEKDNDGLASHECLEIAKALASDAVLDYRKKTWICINWETFPIFRTIFFEFNFDRRKKAKFWDLYIVSCCEILSDKVVVGVIGSLCAKIDIACGVQKSFLLHMPHVKLNKRMMWL